MKENKLKKKNKREIKKEKQRLRQEFHDKYTLSKMVKVNDNWYPTYPKHLVSVYLTITWWDNGNGETIFVISGADDTVIERRFSSNNIEYLKEKWEEWRIFYDKIPQTTNKKWYLERGFEYG